MGDGFGCCEPPSTLIMGFGIFVLLLLFVLFLDDISCTTLTSLLFSESGIIANKSASDIDPKTEVLVADVELLGLVELGLVDSEVVATVFNGFLRGSLFEDSVVEVVEAVEVSAVAGVELDDDDPNKILAIPVGKPLKPSMGPDAKRK